MTFTFFINCISPYQSPLAKQLMEFVVRNCVNEIEAMR